MKAGELMKKRTEVAQRKEAAQGMQGLVIRMQSQIKKALPATITPERFTRIVLTALSSNPKLQQCTPGSFLGAMMQAAQLGLEPNTPLGKPTSSHTRTSAPSSLDTVDLSPWLTVQGR